MSKYIKLAHWLYRECRMVDYDEIASEFNVSIGRVNNYISSILYCDDVFHVKISQSDMNGYNKRFIQVLDIKPYTLISGRRPTLNVNALKNYHPIRASVSDVWRELTSKPWQKLKLFC